mgnify:FL=1
MKQVLLNEIDQALRLVGGATSSIFPQVEALLLSGGDYKSALEFVGSKKNMSRYHSVMDFFFCEMNPEYRTYCRRYYAGMGKPLRELMTQDELQKHNHRLLVALEVAVSRYQKKRRLSWTSFVFDVEEVIHMAS